MATTSIPVSTPHSAWFSVPEGEVGQITNALATIGHTLNPLDLFSIHGALSLWDNTVESIKQTLSLGSGGLIGGAASYTTIFADSQAKVYALEQAGATPYPTKAAAQKQADASNRNVNASGAGIKSPFSGINAIGAFFDKLAEPNLWLRVAEGVLGLALIVLAVGKLTGAEDFIMKNLPKVIPI